MPIEDMYPLTGSAYTLGSPPWSGSPAVSNPSLIFEISRRKVGAIMEPGWESNPRPDGYESGQLAHYLIMSASYVGTPLQKSTTINNRQRPIPAKVPRLEPADFRSGVHNVSRRCKPTRRERAELGEETMHVRKVPPALRSSSDLPGESRSSAFKS